MGLQFMLKSDACGVAVFLEGTTRSWSPIQKKKKKDHDHGRTNCSFTFYYTNSRMPLGFLNLLCMFLKLPAISNRKEIPMCKNSIAHGFGFKSWQL